MEEQVVRAAHKADLQAFFTYLDDHISDNGVGQTAHFLPMARGTGLPPELVEKFSVGLDTALSAPGWRRLWLAFSGEHMVGHIDLRAHPKADTEHRALLGMGVDRSFRRIGLGRRLLDEVFAWAAEHSSLEYVDLDVVSTNIGARTLYEGYGFESCGEIKDLFRIDGESISSTIMARRVVTKCAPGDETK